jgi:hypothetical protein
MIRLALVMLFAEAAIRAIWEVIDIRGCKRVTRRNAAQRYPMVYA